MSLRDRAKKAKGPRFIVREVIGPPKRPPIIGISVRGKIMPYMTYNYLFRVCWRELVRTGPRGGRYVPEDEMLDCIAKKYNEWEK